MRIQQPGTTLAKRTCRQCGAEFMGGPRAWYCPDCRMIRRKEAKARYRQNKRAGKSIVIGQTIGRCEICGKEFIYQSARQRYCPDCAPEAVKKVDREQSRGWLGRAVEKYGQQYMDDHNAAKRIDRDTCVICGKRLPEGHHYRRRLCDDCRRNRLRYSWYRSGHKQHNSELLEFDEWIGKHPGRK